MAVHPVPTSEKVRAPWERSVRGCGTSVRGGCARVVTANTLRELRKRIRFHCCHHSVPGSLVEAQVLNVLSDGLGEWYQVNHKEFDQGDVGTGLGLLEVEDF